MKGKALLGAALAVLLAAYAIVSLKSGPAGWQTRGLVVNAVEPLQHGGVRFRNPGIALAKELPAWVETAKRSQRLELSLSVRSLLPEQVGPARILTLSLSPYERNVMVGQQRADLVLRLRTAWTSPNGSIDGKPVARVPRVFLTNDWVDLRILVEPGRLRMMIGGELVVDEALPPRPFETWDPSHRLALGNELTGTRPWLGEIRRAVVRAGGSTENYADTSKLELPPHFLITGPPPKLVPLLELNWGDAINNLLLYIPLGLLLGFLFGAGSGERDRRVAIGALLLVATVSASMELLQFLFVPRRWPSVDDVIFNTLGGGLGLVLAPWMARRLGPAAGD